ncbi:phage tail tape measure protein [Curtobacterium aurantiacum]|uniref:phage tail tape measure protein n=1 Tax=Curtobacterium aurantiacum TaxID=3236919 RepID=UPI001BE04AAC|nr:phage tail tape measure protein [Curtobacterium flaccumfaciens]MBT1676795.1 phage tail tape measure protein [Curtobacterium flaccumfaciens pv. flaccumfaciens]
MTAQVAGYIQGFAQAESANKKLGSSADDAQKRFENQNRAMEQVGRGLVLFGAAATAAVGIAVARYAEFDAAMSSVQAATHASTSEMNDLRDAAIEAGSSTVFTATEAANAIEELSKAGVSTNDILGGGLSGALDLASAGELKVADAAQIAATAMTQFNARGSEVPHIADLLAAGAGKAQGSVQDLSQALNQGGLVASQAGFSLNETTGTLAAFASAGLLGSDAGTSLKTAIIALQNPSTTAAATMKQYGIDVYDSSGQMLSFGGIAAQLQDKLGGLSDEQRNAALATIFGNDAVRAANVLYSEGASGIAEWTGKVNDNGYAAETARIKLDNLKGDVEKLGGAFDTALIQSGSAANGSLRDLVQTATFLVDGISDLPQPVLSAGVAVTSLVAGLSLIGGGALVAIPKVAALKVQLATLGISMRGAAASAGVAGLALGALTFAISAAFSLMAQQKANADAFTETLDEQTGAITKYSRAAVAKQLSDQGLFESAKNAGVSQKELTDAILEGGSAYDAVKDKLGGNDFTAAAAGFNMFTGKANTSRLALDQVRSSVVQGKEAFGDLSAANTESGESATSAAEQYQAESAQVADLAGQLADLIAQFEQVNNANQDAISANASYQEALAGLDEQVAQQRESTDGYTTSLKENTAIGAGNASMLADLASKAQEAASKQLEVDQSTMSSKDAAEKYSSTLAEQRRKFIESATAAGFNAGEVKKLADRVFQLPSEKEIDILANTKQAQSDLDAFITRNDGRVISVRQQLITEAVKAGAAPGSAKAAYNRDGSVLDFYADGGLNENHVAQFAPAGAMRVWAEPETGGEAYIPLAPSKRTRSLAIWEETGRRLQAFADGGFNVPVTQPASPVFSFPGWSGDSGPSSVSFNNTFAGSTDPAKVVDEMMFAYRTKIRGGR